MPTTTAITIFFILCPLFARNLARALKRRSETLATGNPFSPAFVRSFGESALAGSI
jgi:hypothetical protein